MWSWSVAALASDRTRRPALAWADIVPALPREGVCFVVGCVWWARLACCWLGAPAAFCFSPRFLPPR